MARHDDDGEVDDGRDEWIMGIWWFRAALEFLAVPAIDGKPRPDLVRGMSNGTWYKWRSYHAARKYQRENPLCEGYVLFNLSAAQRQTAELDRIEKERKEPRATDCPGSG